MNDAAVAQLKMKKIEKKTVSVTEPNKERMIARLLGCTAISEKKNHSKHAPHMIFPEQTKLQNVYEYMLLLYWLVDIVICPNGVFDIYINALQTRDKIHTRTRAYDSCIASDRAHNLHIAVSYQ